jgi:UDP:flavonoid glycosyltransferase YjiC (YdhE family)
MARIGVICFPGIGHLNPFTALGHALQERGHEVVFFGIADVESRVRAAGLEFSLIGSQDYPPGTLRKLDERLGQLSGLGVFRFTVERVKNTAVMVLRDAPEAIRKADVDAMVIDQADMGGGSVADYLGLPFASVSVLPPFIRDNRVPPFFFGWPARYDLIGRLRNEFGIRLLSAIANPLYRITNGQRRAWGLKRFERREEALSPIVQITQLPRALEFDGCPQPAALHYTGPFRFDKKRPPVDFPWNLLDGRPLVYASLGTLQNGSKEAFQMIASGCANLGVQLVISLGGGLSGEGFQHLPGQPIVVKFAPQLELLKRASVVITHAGLNTVLESIAEGKPMVAIPIGNDQPGVAARVAAKGSGIVLSRRTLTPAKVEKAVRAVLHDDSYRQAACAIQEQIRQIDGAALAAGIIEEKLALSPLAAARQVKSKDVSGPD